MNFKNIFLPLIAAVSILFTTACSGGGGNATPVVPQTSQQTSAGASGTVNFGIGLGLAAKARTPEYLSALTTKAELWINGTDGGAGHFNCTSIACTANWSTTSTGAVTFVGELDNGTTTLAVGTTSPTLVVGPNGNITMTLNGVVSQATLATTGTLNTLNLTLADGAGKAITTPGTFDNPPILSIVTGGGMATIGAVTSVPTGSYTVGTTTTGTFTKPDTLGTDYSIPITCTAIGTVTVTITTGTNPNTISGTELTAAGITYPTAGVVIASQAATCNSTGSITFQ